MTTLSYLFLGLGIAYLAVHFVFRFRHAKRVKFGPTRQIAIGIPMILSCAMFALAGLSVMHSMTQKKILLEDLTRDPLQQFLNGQSVSIKDLRWIVNRDFNWKDTVILGAKRIGMDFRRLEYILNNELYLIRSQEPWSLSLGSKKLDESPLQHFLLGKKIAWKDLSWVTKHDFCWSQRIDEYWSQQVDEEAARLDINPVALKDVLNNEVCLIRSKPIPLISAPD
jgi:hypothetical protein